MKQHQRRFIPHIYTTKEYMVETEQKWAVHCLLPSSAITLMTAAPGHGKTKLAMVFVKAIARAVKEEGVFCFDQAVEGGKIAYLNLDRMPRPSLHSLLLQLSNSNDENGDPILDDWTNQIEFIEDDVNMLGSLYHEDGDGNRNLVADPNTDKPMALVDHLIERFMGYKLIVIDTWHKLCVNSNRKENESDDTDELMIPIRKLTRTGAAVLILHHTRKDDDKLRGSSAIEGSVDHCLKIGGIPTGEGNINHGKTRMDQIHIFPIEFYDDSTYTLGLNNKMEAGEAIGMWKGWINQSRRLLSEEERSQLRQIRQFELRIKLGERVSPGKYGMHRATLLLIYQKKELDDILAHFRKHGRIETTIKGANPFYVLMV